MEEDPHEQENLATDPDYRNEVERLRTELRRWMEETDDPLCDGPVPPSDYDRIKFTEHH